MPFKLSTAQLNVITQPLLIDEEAAVAAYADAKANWNNHFEVMHGKIVQPWERPTPPLKFHVDEYGKVSRGPDFACAEIPDPVLPAQLPAKPFAQVMEEARSSSQASLDPNQEFVSIAMKLNAILDELADIKTALAALKQ